MYQPNISLHQSTHTHAKGQQKLKQSQQAIRKERKEK